MSLKRDITPHRSYREALSYFRSLFRKTSETPGIDFDCSELEEQCLSVVGDKPAETLSLQESGVITESHKKSTFTLKIFHGSSIRRPNRKPSGLDKVKRQYMEQARHLYLPNMGVDPMNYDLKVLQSSIAGFINERSAVERDVAKDNFTFLCPLGTGGFAKVLLARSKQNNNLYAIKTISKRLLAETRAHRHVLTERLIGVELREMRAVWTNQLHASFQDPKRLYFVLEYCSGGCLFSYLHQMLKAGRVSDHLIRFCFAEMTCGIGELHKLGIIHRDVKFENFLVRESGHIVIADFGFSYFVKTPRRRALLDRVGTRGFESPEMIRGRPHDARTDYWSLGICLYIALYQKNPVYHGAQDNEKAPRQLYGCLYRRMKKLMEESAQRLKVNASDNALMFMSSLLREKHLRLGSSKYNSSHESFKDGKAQWINNPDVEDSVLDDVEDLKTHKWFTGLDWENLAFVESPIKAHMPSKTLG